MRSSVLSVFSLNSDRPALIERASEILGVYPQALNVTCDAPEGPAMRATMESRNSPAFIARGYWGKKLAAFQGFEAATGAARVYRCRNGVDATSHSTPLGCEPRQPNRPPPSGGRFAHRKE